MEPLLKFYDDTGFEGAIALLNKSDRHLIKRKITFPNPSQFNLTKLGGYENFTIHRAIYIDTETTGLSSVDDEVIQLCILPFIFAVEPTTKHAVIIGVYEPYVGFQEPSKELSQEIIDLTGITIDMLKGKSLDIQKIEELIEKSELIIAHNAAFDRPFTHQISMKFSEKKWACSMAEVKWQEQGFESLKLSHLASDLGFYFEPHQADKDCLAGLAILAQVSNHGKSFFHDLIKNSEEDSFTIRAQYAPYEAKDILKQRGYRWKDGSDNTIKGWENVVSIHDVEDERQWLTKHIYSGTPKFVEKKENAYSRFVNS